MSEWLGRRLASMTLHQKIGQLLHPSVRPSASETERIDAAYLFKSLAGLRYTL